MKLPNITKKQTEILEYIVSCIRKDFIPPTVREVSTQFGWSSTNATYEHLRSLDEGGYILSVAFKSRGIRLTDKTKRHFNLYLTEQKPVANPLQFILREDVEAGAVGNAMNYLLLRGTVVTKVDYNVKDKDD